MTPTLALLLALQGSPAPPPPEAPEAPPKRYGDQGTSHFGLALGLGGGSGGFVWGAGLNYGYFVIDGVAPGLDADVSGGTKLLTTGLLLGTVRVVPLRTESVSIFLIGRGGRVFLSSHPDGWGVGGGGGIIFFTGAHVGFQLAYDVLRLTPSTFCGDLSGGCTRHGFGVGLVLGF
jgi:hypothetical protein